MMLAQIPVTIVVEHYYLALARRCRHVSQAREVYFLPGRLRLVGSSADAADMAG